MALEEGRRQELREKFSELATSGDPQLRKELVEAHMGLAEFLARRFSNRGESLDDLVQVASLALVKAVDRFDPERGVEFSTYATHTIAGELKRHFRDRGWAIRAPRRMQELYLRLGQVVSTLSQELGRSPTVPEMARSAGVTEEEVLEALEAGQAYRSSSLDSPASGGEDEGEDLASRLGEEDPGFERAEGRAFLSPLVAELPPRQRQILRLRFYEGLTQSEIAKEMGISQMHVSRLLSRSLMVLRSRAAELEPGESQRVASERQDR